MLNSQVFVRRQVGMAATLLAFGLIAVVPAIAQAGAVAGTEVTFPPSVTVGETGRQGSIALINLNSPPNTADTNSVCNALDMNPPCGSFGIELVPACSQLVPGPPQCTVAGAEPGVFQISSTATGRTATACQGMIFNVTGVNPVIFTPQPVGTRVQLPGVMATCAIDFTFNVLKSPTGDQDPGTPGNQTAQVTRHRQFVGALLPMALNATAQDVDTTTVLRAGPPSVSTTASPDIELGGQLTDNATVSGLVNPIAGSTVTFRLYPPADPTCTGTPVFTSTKTTALAGSVATATSDAFTPTEAGVYRWIATFSGDANNLPASGTCGEVSETRTVSVPSPPPPPPDTTPPDTTITKAKINSAKDKATFKFSSTEADSTFLCKLDKKPFAPCSSPKSYKRLKDGKHKFRVTATDAAGNVDPSPAVKRFKIK